MGLSREEKISLGALKPFCGLLGEKKVRRRKGRGQRKKKGKEKGKSEDTPFEWTGSFSGGMTINTG